MIIGRSRLAASVSTRFSGPTADMHRLLSRRVPVYNGVEDVPVLPPEAYNREPIFSAADIRSVPKESVTITPSELAKQEFVQGVCQIPGASVQVYGGQTLAEQSIRVFVPDVLGPVAEQVYALEVRIRRNYRHARLNVEVEAAPSGVQGGCRSIPGKSWRRGGVSLAKNVRAAVRP
jgi:hypothetical protein